MKKINFLILAAVALTATAQNKIDFPGRMVVEQTRIQSQGGYTDEGLTAPMAYSPAAKYDVLVDFGDNEIDFEGIDVGEYISIGNIAAVNVTAARMEEIAGLPGVLSVSLGYEKKPMLYKARPAADVDKVQQGEGLSMPYKGKGVVTGLYDTGLDVNHINFLNADGTPRTERLWVFSGGSSGREYSTPSEISSFTTENRNESHGTHVLGIMAGSYNGPAKYGVMNGNSGVLTQQNAANSHIPFYGVAPEATLAVACGTLVDNSILGAVKNIMDFAKSQGKPAVVNLSIGNNLGPHDGTDATSKSLATLGQEGIICISAGNEGDENISIQAYGETVKTLLSSENPQNKSYVNGTVQFWGSDNLPFTLRIIGYNSSTRNEVFSYAIDTNLAGKTVSSASMSGFSNSFTGSLTASSNVNTANNRYNVSLQISGVTPRSGIYLGVSIEPKDNQNVDGFTNGIVFTTFGEGGFTTGNPYNSINGMACGENVVVVGSFTTAATWASLPNGTPIGYSPAPTVSAISSFSSYGYVFNGRQLPDVCAPGEGISSSYSIYYVEAAGTSVNGWLTGEYTTTETGLKARNSPWGIMQGTSMSSPFVAGVIALWLEADPTLTYAEVMDVIANSSTKQLGSNARWGYGKINALKGIQYVLDNYAAVTDVAIDRGEVTVSANGRDFEVYMAGAQTLTASIYDLNGACVARESASGNIVNVSADGAVAGVYVLRVESEKGVESRKVVLR